MRRSEAEAAATYVIELETLKLLQALNTLPEIDDKDEDKDKKEDNGQKKKRKRNDDGD